jgi:hypothetical protein
MNNIAKTNKRDKEKKWTLLSWDLFSGKHLNSCIERYLCYKFFQDAYMLGVFDL